MLITALGFIPVLLAGLFLLGMLIFIHESGHFMVAKLLRIKVEVFSLGFGPKLLRFNRGGTEYCLSILPLGGYVKMLGENPDESLRGTPEEFLSRSKFERFLVLVMGASLNIVLAVILTAGIYMHGVPEPSFVSEPPMIGGVDPNGAAAEAGLHVRDVIVAVDGVSVGAWRDMVLQVALNPDRTVDFKVRRDGQVLDVPVKIRAHQRDQVGVIGIEPHAALLVAEVIPGGAAAKAGIRAGDTILKAEDEEMFGASSHSTFVKIISENAGRPVSLTIQRDDKPMAISVTPTELEEEGKKRGYVGVVLSTPHGIRKYGPVDSVTESVKENYHQAGAIFMFLERLVSRQISPMTLSGPIDIFRLAGTSLRAGWITYLGTMAFISLQLGIMNLLPIPILDGGHIFILFIEGLIRRDLSMQIKERVMQFGFILLLLIMGGVISLDVYKNFFIQ